MKENGTVEIVDFGYSPEPKTFHLAPDTFEACPDLPADLFAFAANLSKLDVRDPNVVEKLLEFFDVVLFDDSAARFRERVHGKKNNIGVPTMMKIIQYLLEQYGLRPTQPSSDSSTPSTEESGTTSTGGAQNVESIHSHFGSLGS